MRCKFCGSTSVHPDSQHKSFSAKKAAAGAVTIGVIGAAAGFIGKEQKGYRCGECGAFMESCMDSFQESSINSAIRDAESGRSTHMFDYYKKQYCNIRARIPEPEHSSGSSQTGFIEDYSPVIVTQQIQTEPEETIKHVYYNNRCNLDCPIFIQSVVIKTKNNQDYLSLIARNDGTAGVRSAYFEVITYDDTGDEIGRKQCVYQNLSVEPHHSLPEEKEFALDTDIAYTVFVECEKAAMTDGSVWRKEEDSSQIMLEPQLQLDESNFPKYRYLSEGLKDVSLAYDEKPLFMPHQQDGLWRCVCGQPVKTGQRCPHCNAEYDELIEHMSQQELSKIQKEKVRKLAAERTEASLKLYEEAKEEEYEKALVFLGNNTKTSIADAASIFEKLGEYKDSKEQVEKCKEAKEELIKEEREKKKAEEEARKKKEAQRKKVERARKIAEEKQKEEDYQKALAIKEGESAEDIRKAIKAFSELGDWKDSEQIKEDLEKKLAAIDAEANRKRKKKLKITAVIAVLLLLCVGGFFGLRQYAYQRADSGDFKTAAKLEPIMIGDDNFSKYVEYGLEYNNKQFHDAGIGFKSLGDYREAFHYFEDSFYQYGCEQYEAGDYKSAIDAFSEIPDYEGSEEYMYQLKDEAYDLAVKALSDEDYDKAKRLFEVSGLYDSGKYLEVIDVRYNNAAVAFLKTMMDFEPARETLFWNDNTTYDFLKGGWHTARKDMHFKLEGDPESWNVEWDIPSESPSSSCTFEKGVMYGLNGDEKTPFMEFSAENWDQIKIKTLSDGKTYTLFRD